MRLARTLIRRVSDRPVVAGLIVAVGAAAALGGFLWFRPDKLFLDDVVHEGFPTTETATEAASPEPERVDDAEDEAPEPEGPVLESEGSFESHNRYTTSGRASVYRLDDGSRVLRFEDFETDNGPDLLVYLSAAPPGTTDGSLADDFVDLGRLKGNIGDQNYELPDDVDLGHHSTVVVWCRRFTVSFGAAVLGTA